MRTPAASLALLGLAPVGLALAATAVEAAPVAEVREDVDGDGTADPIELDRRRRGAGRRRKRADVEDRARCRQGAARWSAEAARRSQIVVDLSRGRGARSGRARSARRRGPRGRRGSRSAGRARRATTASRSTRRRPASTATRARSDVRRCDGKPAYLFAERLDGARFRPVERCRRRTSPTRRRRSRRSSTPRGAPPPLLYQAQRRVAPGRRRRRRRRSAIPRELDDGRLDTVWREELAASAGEGQFFTFEPRVERGARAAAPHRARQSDVAAAMRAHNRPRQLAVVVGAGRVADRAARRGERSARAPRTSSTCRSRSRAA